MTMSTEQTQTEKPAGLYVPPEIEVIDIELAQNFMESGTLPDMDGDNW
ncbi:hypothetical protein SDC9_148560 [bioreactor metagenome]|uniref:Uncharacterized protein n=1 Tax=bioreactor metagenome TaxID=1076179 RepID=A0A645EHE4_9ZZZZ